MGTRMTGRALPKLASWMATVWLVAASPTVTAAQTQTFPGYNPQDPIGSAAQALWQRIEKQCGPLRLPVRIGTASRPQPENAFSRDQGNNVMQQVHAAFSRLDGVRMAPFLDIGPVLNISDTGILDSALAGNAKEQLSKIEIEIRATGQRIGPSTRLLLSAHGWNGYESCSPSLDPFTVSEEFIGEIYRRNENIFDEVAEAIWEQSTETSNTLALSAHMLNGAPVNPGWLEFFSDRMRRALSKQADEEKKSRIRAPRHVSFAMLHDPSSDEARRWSASVSVEQRHNGYRIAVSANRKDTTPVFSGGLVAFDDLPTATQWAALGSSRNQNAVSAPRLTETPLRIDGRVEGGRGLQQYAFSIARESYVEVDIPLPSLRGPGKLLVEVFAPGHPPLRTIHIANPSRPNLRRYRLGAGQYTIRVANSGPTRQEYQLRARAVDTSDMLLPEAPGRLIRRFQNWYASVVEDPASGKRTCYAYTAATAAGPTNWREQAPFILLSAESEGSGAIQHLLDDKRYYRPGAPIEASVTEGGDVRLLNASAPGNFIRPMKEGSNGQPILDMDAVAGYNKGTTLELNGTTPDGRPAHVVYSLQGYRAAVNAMSLECGRRDLANALVWK